jgi:glycosyltransferase involved in cell wall biosynthesis
LDAWFASGVSDRGGRLILCGEVLPAYRRRLASQLAHSSVHELGFVQDVGQFMRQAQLLLLPSVTEGSALVTYEAQAAGCALLVSESAGAPCEHLVHGLIHAPGDVATLTEHLRLVDRDRGFLDALRKRARAHASSLTWTAAGERLVAAYQEGLDRGSLHQPPLSMSTSAEQGGA